MLSQQEAEIERQCKPRRRLKYRMHYEYDDFVEAVARRLRELRAERGFSQRNFAKEHGWHLSHWAAIEAGQKMSLPTLVKAANSFDLSVENLVSSAMRYEGPGPGSRGFKPTDQKSD